MPNTTQSIENARERILQLTREVEEFSRSNLPRETFFREFLQRVLMALGAPAGAVWMFDHGRRLRLIHNVRLEETGFYENPQAGQLNQKLLNEVMTKGEVRAYSPDDPEKVQLPTPHLIIVGSLQQNKKCVGAIEVFQRPNTSKEARAGYLQFVEQMCGHAARYLDGGQTAEKDSSEETTFLKEYGHFTLQLQQSLDVSEVAQIAVNDGRHLIGCDRLSVALMKGRKAVIKAISGQDSVNHRANLVRRMTTLATKVIEMGEPITSADSFENLPPQIEQPLGDYLQESGSRMVKVIPLFQNESPFTAENDEDKPRKKVKKRKAVGGLLVEQVSQSEPKPEVLRRTDLVKDHVGSALANAQTHQRIFLLPLWRALGRCVSWFQGRNLLKAAAVLVVITAVATSLALVPAEYRVEGEGQLMPVVQHEVFVPLEGEVSEIYVEGGDRVVEGQRLLKLRNDDLHAELLASRNQLAEKRQLLVALQVELDKAYRASSKEEQNRIEGRMVETQIEIEGLQEQIQILEERRDLLTVRAPHSGVVSSFQIEKLLQNRPVQRGEVLLEIMNDKGNWHLELDIEEHRMGHLLQAQANRDSQALPVEFILATDPASTYEGMLKSVATRSNPSEKKGNVVEVLVDIDSDQLPQRRIGAEVIAKIGCGQKSLGYVLFGDVVEFIHKQFWL